MFVKTLVPTCQNTKYDNLQANSEKLKSHILLSALTAGVCTFSTVLNCCLIRVDFIL
jgi:hypothetical protein